MEILGPIKFLPIFQPKVWGGKKIFTELKYDFSPLPNCGEAWMLSGVPGKESIAAEGPLEGNNLSEILEIFMSDLVGEKVYTEFGEQFPLLIKFLDAKEWLSIQVHPDDALAQERGLERGKTEMWYILDAEPNAQLISGFSKSLTQESYKKMLQTNRLETVLNYESVQKGDVFYIPAGRVHAIGPGILLAEIQQSSDTTYRIYDWNRKDKNGKGRELHTNEALDALDFELHSNYKTDYKLEENATESIVDAPYFNCQIMQYSKPIKKNYEELDSFVVYIVSEGSMQLHWGENESMDIGKGDVILLPAILNEIEIFPTPNASLLEVFIK